MSQSITAAAVSLEVISGIRLSSINGTLSLMSDGTCVGSEVSVILSSLLSVNYQFYTLNIPQI
ncbi:MAG: hypothetical protein JO327_10565 [Nitrososphaeraceae archaeon]|nr:hypothetical protein [Nitrososphaeraceae archaeon]MBV9668558.1 hypothetical protein [Nitrososphaeraceae archaeon]